MRISCAKGNAGFAQLGYIIIQSVKECVFAAMFFFTFRHDLMSCLAILPLAPDDRIKQGFGIAVVRLLQIKLVKMLSQSC